MMGWKRKFICLSRVLLMLHTAGVGTIVGVDEGVVVGWGGLGVLVGSLGLGVLVGFCIAVAVA